MCVLGVAGLRPAENSSRQFKDYRLLLQEYVL
jgi:hypothetical protein